MFEKLNKTVIMKNKTIHLSLITFIWFSFVFVHFVQFVLFIFQLHALVCSVPCL